MTQLHINIEQPNDPFRSTERTLFENFKPGAGNFDSCGNVSSPFTLPTLPQTEPIVVDNTPTSSTVLDLPTSSTVLDSMDSTTSSIIQTTQVHCPAISDLINESLTDNFKLSLGL